MKQRYNFDRVRNGELMAQGVAVHAISLEEATDLAYALLRRQSREARTELRFADNEPCVAALKCPICGTKHPARTEE